MIIQSVFATDENGGIGISNTLPWPFNRHDMMNFLNLTTDTILVMGANTWYSLPKKLKNRPHVVLTSKLIPQLYHNDEYPDHVINYSLPINEIYNQLDVLSKYYASDTVSIIGGKMVYESLNGIVDVIHHTIIPGKFNCDTYLDLKALTDQHSVIYYKDSQVISGLTISKYERKNNNLNLK